jgi:hypothetical protein
MFFYFVLHKPIFSEKVNFVADKPKIDDRIPGYKPGGGDKKVLKIGTKW